MARRVGEEGERGEGKGAGSTRCNFVDDLVSLLVRSGRSDAPGKIITAGGWSVIATKATMSEGKKGKPTSRRSRTRLAIRSVDWKEKNDEEKPSAIDSDSKRNTTRGMTTHLLSKASRSNPVSLNASRTSDEEQVMSATIASTSPSPPSIWLQQAHRNPSFFQSSRPV